MISKHGFTISLATRLLAGLVLLVVAPGCDEEDGGPGDELGDGDGDGETGDGDGDASGDGDGDATSGGDKGGDFGGDDEGELMGCALNETAADCMAEVGCAPVYGQALVEDGQGWCTAAEQEFIGCAESGELCPPLSKTLCDEGGYWQTSECVPDNLDVCEAPGEITGDC